MSRLRRPALCVGGIAAVLLAGLLFAACQSSVVQSTSSSAVATAGSSTTGAPSSTSVPTSGASSTTTRADLSLGKTVYFYGTDASGRPISRTGVTGMMGSAVACVNCHSSDARGQTIQLMMMGQMQVPDIRWTTLTAPPTEPGDVAFDPDSFFRAVTQGVDPTGAPLKTFMPRWQLTRTESDAIIEYLKTL
jgi:hypothetical protein